MVEHLFSVKMLTSPRPPPPSLFIQAVIQRAAAETSLQLAPGGFHFFTLI